jgi:hypothetical protein
VAQTGLQGQAPSLRRVERPWRPTLTGWRPGHGSRARRFSRCILRLCGVIDRDRFGARGRELERIGRPDSSSRRQTRSLALALTSFTKPAEISLLAAFCAIGALERWRGDETEALALGCGAQQNELRIGKFDGHGCTLRVFDWGLNSPGPSPTRAPDRRDRRG